MGNKYLQFIAVLAMLVISVVAFAQVGPPPAPPPPPPPPPGTPIDGGVVLLIAAGLIYGANKLYNNKA